MRLALILATVLVLLVTASSAMLRLSQAGAGCTPWPACYEQRADHAVQASLPEAQVPAWHRAVRLTHRITASTAGLVFLFIVFFGWRAWSGSERLAGLLLLAVSVGLALLGRVTPSPLPAVVQANLLGGHLLLAALAWLQVRQRLANHAGSHHLAGPTATVALLMLLVLSQAALGGLVSARSAAAACQPAGCQATPELGGGVLDPLRPNTGLPAAQATSPQRQGLLQAHTVSGMLTLLLALAVAWRGRHGAPLAAGALAAVALVGAALGWAMRLQPMPLATTVTHSVLAAVLLALATAVYRRLRRT